MILSDKSILDKLKKKEISIAPFARKNLQPASYDLTLGNTFIVFDHNKLQIINPKKDLTSKMIKIVKPTGKFFVLHPGAFVLAMVAERTGVDKNHVGRLEGKSSLARLGLFIHITSGFLDPGNNINMTLELFNASGLPIMLYPGMKIAQMAFEEMSCGSKKGYGDKGLNSKYFGSKETEASKYHLNFKRK